MIAGQDADDLLRMTFDQVRHRPTIPPAFQTCCLFWFRLRLGRENASAVTPRMSLGLTLHQTRAHEEDELPLRLEVTLLGDGRIRRYVRHMRTRV